MSVALMGAIGCGASPAVPEAALASNANSVAASDRVGDEGRGPPGDVEEAPAVPERDQDGDGVADANDQCPSEAEDLDGWQDEDGCPDPDNDGDGVPDTRDYCPSLHPNGREDPNEVGCPEPVVCGGLMPNRVEILEHVRFSSESAQLRSPYPRIVRALGANIGPSPDTIPLVRVEGHATPKEGRPMRLSKRRAMAVARALVSAGVPPARVRVFGCGISHPVDSNRTRAGQERNRRVEFRVLRPVPGQGLQPSAPSTCRQVRFRP